MFASFVGSDRTYGSRRVWHDMLALGHRCGLHRIERLMRAQALRARPRRRGLPRDLGERSAIADNILDRQFVANAPNQKWVADFTYIWTAEGWLYAAAVMWRAFPTRRSTAGPRHSPALRHRSWR
jgi:putative transposase